MLHIYVHTMFSKTNTHIKRINPEVAFALGGMFCGVALPHLPP